MRDRLVAYQVTDEENEFAKQVLKARIDNGEDPYDILGIPHEFKYYVDKIVAGIMHIDTILFYRITGTDSTVLQSDDGIRFCCNCLKKIPRYSGRPYCRKCWDELYGKDTRNYRGRYHRNEAIKDRD